MKRIVWYNLIFNYGILSPYGEEKNQITVQFNVPLIAKLNIISEELRSVADPGSLRTAGGGGEGVRINIESEPCTESAKPTMGFGECLPRKSFHMNPAWIWHILNKV